MEPYLWPVIGGACIGISAVFLMFSSGKIAGISGIVWGAIASQTADGDRVWRWVFLLGILLGAFLFHFVSGKSLPSVAHSPFEALAAGLIVGIGVKLGNGCTSGHPGYSILFLPTVSLIRFLISLCG